MTRAGHLFLGALLITVALVGCLDSSPTRAEVDMADGYPTYKPSDGLYHFKWTHDGLGPLHAAFAPGALSSLENQGEVPLTVNLTPNILVVEPGETGDRLVLATEHKVDPGQTVRYLAPPAAESVEVLVEGTVAVLHSKAAENYQPSATQIVSGENVVELMKLQAQEFRHREPGSPNYAKAIDYFATYLEDLGYEVEADPYGTQDATLGGLACLPARGTSYCPETLANVVATKPGTDPDAGIIFVAGGHFDMVNGTTHAAFDDTSGTIGTLELARALAPYEFRHTLKFGLWGGEENGILGSQFWVRTNPEAVARTVSYWNLDVIGMSWPSPKPMPDPVMIAAGPDAPAQGGQTTDPVSQDLLTWSQQLQETWFGYPSEVDGTEMFLYEGVASGQATGYAGVNAQSDHTPFIAAGVPSYFIFNADALDMPVMLHTESDTLENMTRYAWWEKEADLDSPDPWPNATVKAEAEQVLAQSFETTLFFPLYHALLVDQGVYVPPGADQRAAPALP